MPDEGFCGEKSILVKCGAAASANVSIGGRDARQFRHQLVSCRSGERAKAAGMTAETRMVRF